MVFIYGSDNCVVTGAMLAVIEEPVCLHSSDQHSLILKLVIGCISRFSMGPIQTGHTGFLPL